MGRKNRIRRLAGWALAGSAIVILAGVSAAPAPVTSAVDRVDGALSLYARGDRKGACAVAGALVATSPRSAEAWMLSGMMAEDRAAPREAEAAYAKALPILEAAADPRATDVLVSLADLLRRKGDPAGALAALDKVARERGESVRIRHARVLALVDLGRFDAAFIQTRAMAEEKLGGGVARKLEKLIRSSMDAAASRKG